jgi:lipopolysaccharide biosynthesis protein
MEPNRVALFAHFDAEDQVKRYVVEYLKRLSRVCAEVVFISTSRLTDSALDQVRPYASKILLKDNSGFDFGMWQHGLEHIDLARVDEIVLTNSSIFGPIYPLEPIFRRMADLRCDFWGMTDNFEYRWHLQSYFLVFKRRVCQGEPFRAFFRSVLPYRSKGPVVLGYEVGLTSFLVESGFRPGAFAPVESWASWADRRRMDLERRWNPTLFHPEKLLSRGMPFVKAMLLRDNIGMVSLDPVYQAISASGYDLALIEFDRAPVVRHAGLRARVRRLWSRIAVESEKTSPLAHPA